jgi:hypothetical protein
MHDPQVTAFANVTMTVWSRDAVGKLRPVPASSPAWDVFISHASEDKDALVRPLATELSRLGLRVWYDEFTLRLGDSISQSIDRGLADSRAGIVIISQSFISKPWPRRELAGLVAGEVGREQLIVPVWYNITREQLLEFSPTLADRAAILADQHSQLVEIAIRILERVRPDLHQAHQRKLAFEQVLAENERTVEWVNSADLILGPIRHERLPKSMMCRLRIVREALLEVIPVDWETTVDNFRRDITPDDELYIWEYITGIYLTILNEFKLSHSERKELYSKLLRSTFQPWDQLVPEAPDWERRAFELSNFDGHLTSSRFASCTIEPDTSNSK